MNFVAKPARDDRREAILAIARQVFMELGYAATSMSTIAARVGGSKGTLYNHFRSKAALFAAVVQEQCDRDQTALFETATEIEDVGAALTLLARRVLRLMLSDDVIAMHRMVVAESVRFPEIGEAVYEAGPKQGKKRLIAYIHQAVADGRLRPMDPERAAEQAMDMTMGSVYRRRLWNVGPRPTEAEIDACADAAIVTFMAAYGPVPGQPPKARCDQIESI